MTAPEPVRKSPAISYENRASLDSVKIKSQTVRILFWNLENLYDPADDSLTLDDEFTASGVRRWTWTRFARKLNNVAGTVMAAGEWSPPALVGVCEIENRFVLNRLVYETPLARWKYRIVHHDSPDRRGVDAALLYRPDLFRVITSRACRLRFPFDTAAQTREILVVTGVLGGRDTLTTFVNHWPSRRGGQLASQPRRMYAAWVLRGLVDSVLLHNSRANILIVGDFNDEPDDRSLAVVLRARKDTLLPTDTALYNLIGLWAGKSGRGTLKYRDRWSTFDQVIVTGAMLRGRSGLRIVEGSARPFMAGFLTEEDPAYLGVRLNRTYTGPRYHGGFSDHLPVRAEIRCGIPLNGHTHTPATVDPQRLQDPSIR